MTYELACKLLAGIALVAMWWIIIAAIRAPRSPILERLGERIRRAREAKGMSVREFAWALLLSKTTVRRIEAGECDPRIGTLEGIVWVLDMKLPYLLWGHRGFWDRVKDQCGHAANMKVRGFSSGTFTAKQRRSWRELPEIVLDPETGELVEVPEVASGEGGAMKMSKPMPISEAVKAAQAARDDLVYWEIDVLKQGADGGRQGVLKARRGPGPETAYWRDDDRVWRNTTNEDAGSALRGIAEQLAPDPQAKALEIAAVLSEKSIFLPRWYREKLLWIIAFVTSPEKYKAGGVIEAIDELLTLPPVQRLKLPPQVIDALEGAREFFEQQADDE